ncbi:polyphosphate polymerase domain-containing protein [Mangrovibacterium sp.]|uniref:polyphosphate polymerase domain-containing protein n=1 Tax=Mangrovibacterium sp. TaxID=1961364 RepID=UPI0035652DE4
MKDVKLMDRTDTKYWFHVSQLADLLEEIRDDYFVLEIDGQKLLPYSTTYFDTQNNGMYTQHHNGKLNRYKVRRRSYVSSGISFLEVKQKTNKGRTIKERIRTEYDNPHFTTRENEFLIKQIPHDPNELSPVLSNRFTRLTLVSKNYNERCTIDLNLEFESKNKTCRLDKIAIVEIKSEGNSNGSPIASALFEKRIRIGGFSKYCIGRVVTDAQIKRNAFKGKIRRLEKATQKNLNLYHQNS